MRIRTAKQLVQEETAQGREDTYEGSGEEEREEEEHEEEEEELTLPTRTMITDTHLTDPETVPEGWVRQTEPSGRTFYVPEINSGINTKLLVPPEEDGGVDVDSSAEELDDELDYDEDSSDSSENEALILNRVGTVFMSNVDVGDFE
mmetsp:Transcript_18554/g.60911  ORF Transcript_18554/g.60911 Transcript_18554/m.60911 type:complete len:147 (+) Transcript_18554:953-1393(+)